MLNHTYTSVKNANIVDCGKKQHIPSQPFPLLKENFLSEYRTELDKKKVLANLGIATDLSLEWEYIKGDIGRSESLMKELDSRTKYISKIDGFQKTVLEGINYLETVVGGELEGEELQNERLTALEQYSKELDENLNILKSYIENTVDINIEALQENLNTITEKVNNITELIQVSSKEGNALSLIVDEENSGLYVPDLSEEVSTASLNIEGLQENVLNILNTYVTKEELGGGDFDFVDLNDFNNYTDTTDKTLESIKEELKNTVKTDLDGHVNKLYVNEISNNNNENNTIKITDSFEVTEGVPLDVRFVVKNLEQLHSLKPLVCYAGMGVIVQDLASLYILREPTNGIIDEEYIRDEEGINWKCPEDLVIEVLTLEEYDKKLELDSINPNMFYYIHEEVVDEPIRENFDSDESYTEALNKWLRVLQLKYMSAVWGQEIEELVASKASNTAIKSLESEILNLSVLIDSLSGGASEINLKDLNTLVLKNTLNLNTLIEDEGTVPTIQKDLHNLLNLVTNDYVTKEEITNENSTTEYIFVKKTSFEEYINQHNLEIAESINTKNVNTEKVVFGGNTLTTTESDLVFNAEKIALSKQVPVIEVLDNDTFESKTDIDENTYYYIYDTEDRHLLKSELESYISSQTTAYNTLSLSINNNSNNIGALEELSTNNKNTLVYAINELNVNLKTLITNVGDILNLPEDNTQIVEAISDIYSKIDEISTKLNSLDNRISSLEINESVG